MQEENRHDIPSRFPHAEVLVAHWTRPRAANLRRTAHPSRAEHFANLARVNDFS